MILSEELAAVVYKSGGGAVGGKRSARIILIISDVEKKLIWWWKAPLRGNKLRITDTSLSLSLVLSVSHVSTVTPCTVWTWLDLSLALGYVETDELLNASLILLLSGAAGRVLTWLSKRSLRLPHLLVHPRQTQPKGNKRHRMLGMHKSCRGKSSWRMFLMNKHTAWLYLRWLAARLYSEGPGRPRPRRSV